MSMPTISRGYWLISSSRTLRWARCSASIAALDPTSWSSQSASCSTVSATRILKTIPRPLEHETMKTEVDHAYVSHLSDAAHRKSFDPWRDIDWSVPFDDSHFYLPPDLVSLYGTELWNSMTREQQVRLSMHEAPSTLAQALWFPNILTLNLLS